jgi:uncharacterized protein
MPPRTELIGSNTESDSNSHSSFLDPLRVIAEDLDHSGDEQRYFCFGRIEDAIMTVRFTWRNRKIRIFGAGYWRKGKTIYEKANGKIQQR